MDELDIVRRKNSVVIFGEIFPDNGTHQLKDGKPVQDDTESEVSETEIYYNERRSRKLSYCVIFVAILIHCVLTVCHRS